MNISFGIIVVNGEPFIRYNLENLYPHAHEILIVEGAVEKFKHAATPDGHSLDDTVKIIKEFPDPENKIKLIQREGFWPEKDEMSNAYMAQCTGDYIWQVDVDEFYKPEDIDKVRKFLIENPDVTRVDIQTINFWHSFKAVIQGASYIFGADQFRRIFKYRPGYRFSTHRPPTVIDENGEHCCDAKIVTAKELLEKINVCMYHYSYVFQNYVEQKADYYSKMNWGKGHEEGMNWAKNEWAKLSNPLRVHIIKFPPSWIVPFDGQHPSIINKMIENIKYNENIEILRFLDNDYKKFKKTGEDLTKTILALNVGETSRWRAATVTLKKLFPLYGYRNIRANCMIVIVAYKIIFGKICS